MCALCKQYSMLHQWDTQKINIISDALKKELKDIIHEVLDERELEKKLNAPYDFPDFVP